MDILSSLMSAFGLSTASGLNAYLPLFTVGVLARFNLITLGEPFNLLSHPLVLLIIAALAIFDFIGDKLPAVDHVLHAAGLVIHPIAGAILFLAANSQFGTVHPIVAVICGVILAGGTHLARAAVRPVATTATAGTANPLISLLEDGAAFVLTLLSVLVPVLALILVLVAAFVLWRLLRPVFRTWRTRNEQSVASRR